MHEFRTFRGHAGVKWCKMLTLLDVPLLLIQGRRLPFPLPFPFRFLILHFLYKLYKELGVEERGPGLFPWCGRKVPLPVVSASRTSIIRQRMAVG